MGGVAVGGPAAAFFGRSVASDVRDVLERHAGLFGFEVGSLALRSAEYSPLLDTWYVDLDVLHDNALLRRVARFGGLAAPPRSSSAFAHAKWRWMG